MSDQFEYTEPRTEVLTVVEGPAVMRVMAALFSTPLTPGRLEYRRISDDGSLAAVCWLPPARLEIRTPATGNGTQRVRARLEALRANAPAPPFTNRVRQLIARIEAWSYADSDSGTGPAEAMAEDLRALGALAPSPQARLSLRQAQDALDDGLPAEAVAATLYRVLREAEGIDVAGQASGLEPSPSG
jgi:hypothetical protein